MVRQQMAGRWRMSSVQMSFAIMPAIVYWLAGQPFATTGANAISIGTVVAFTTLQTRLFFPIGQLLSVGIDIQTSGALFERIFEYLDLPVDLEEGTVALGAGSARVRGEVRLEHVGFTYEAGGSPILQDVDLVVPAGSTTAIVGETGAGKTTVGYLVARLYDPTSGRVTSTASTCATSRSRR